MSKTVVLVYSGGLDTSICIPLMREEYGYDRVVTVTVDVGQPAEDIAQAAEKAKAMNTEHYTVDAKEEFARDYCFASIKANGYYQGYPISTSIARPLIAAKAVEVAKKLGATCFCPRLHRQRQRPVPHRVRDPRADARSRDPRSRPRAQHDPHLGNRIRPEEERPDQTEPRERSGRSTKTSGAAPSKAAASKSPTTLRLQKSSNGRRIPVSAAK